MRKGFSLGSPFASSSITWLGHFFWFCWRSLPLDLLVFFIVIAMVYSL
jgi:hypothetical protein